MIAPAHLRRDTSTARMNAVKTFLNECSREAVAVASISGVPEIAEACGIDRELARMLRSEARKELVRIWAFDEAAWRKE